LFGRGRGECGESLPHVDHRKMLWKKNKDDKEKKRKTTTESRTTAWTHTLGHAQPHTHTNVLSQV